MMPLSLQKKLRELHDQQKKIVLVTGVFDVLHEEHTRFLRAAAQLADALLIGVESDVRVKQIKGSTRPIHNQEKRVSQLKSLRVAEEVFILPEQFSRPIDHENLIASIKPTFLAVSSHTDHLEEKKRIIEKFGGELKVVLEQNPEISSTKIIERFSSQQS